MNRVRSAKCEVRSGRNIKIVIEYDGTNYHGWQSQLGSGKATIQDTLELAIKTLTGEDVKLASSGRTDAGVHALGHVANFVASKTMPSGAWAPALNHLLPEDIRILSSHDAPDDFHSRHDAKGKIYRYRILNRRAPTALHRRHVWHIKHPLDVGQMRIAVQALLGKHDFSAFRGSGCGAKSPVRTLRSASITRDGDFIDIELEADAFLQYMVRNIVGTLVEVGLGRFTPDDVKMMLESRDRTTAGRTAPPQGLYLVKVFYKD